MVGGNVADAFMTLPAIPAGGFDPSRPSTVLAMDDTTVGPLSGDVFRLPAALKEMLAYLPEAFIAAEDARIREHYGVDPRGFARAMLTNLRTRRIAHP
jgi:penicillin-binding protein 1A